MVKHLPTMQETQVRSLGWEDPLEKEMATHSSTLAWKIPWTEESDRLQSMGCKELDMTDRLHFTLSPINVARYLIITLQMEKPYKNSSYYLLSEIYMPDSVLCFFFLFKLHKL